MAYSEMQIDALRELANIGSGGAARSLSGLLGQPVDISVPSVLTLPLPDAVDLLGGPEAQRHGILVPVVGDLRGSVVLLATDDDAEALCSVFGLDPHDEHGRSMLAEVGNMLGAAYIGAFAAMTGMPGEPGVPQVVYDMLGAMLASICLSVEDTPDSVMVLDSSLALEETTCSVSFLLLPEHQGIDAILASIGMA